jgi:mannose-1-phosphate guanylyltransferase/phosphomannomutase
MPSLLTKLGAEVLAVNPFASTASATSTAEVRDSQVARLAGLVQVSGSDLGFVIDPEGELAVVVDDTGHTLEPEELLLSIVSLIKQAVPDASVAVPVNVTSAVEQIFDTRGGVVRTKLWGASLMETAAARSVMFAGTPDGGCIWPEFLPAYDAAVTLVKLLDLLAAVDRPLSSVVADLPEIHVAHETIVTPWERKGTVMREIVERAGNRELELIDGVKVIDGDQWALVLPDPDEALTHVWAEAGTDVDARRLAQEYVQRILQVLR